MKSDDAQISFESIPPDGVFNFKYSLIPASQLKYGANVTWTANATLTALLTDSKSGYFVVGNSHPVATVHPLLKSQGFSVNRFQSLDLETFYNREYRDGNWTYWQDTVKVQDKEQDDNESFAIQQNLSYNWDFKEGNFSAFSNSSRASHEWRDLGDYQVRVTVKDWSKATGAQLNSTTADIPVHVRNQPPSLTFLEAREMPAMDSDTSTIADDDVDTTDVLRVKVHWSDGDAATGADQVFLDFYDVSATAAALNATREVNATGVGANVSVVELPLVDFKASRLRVCIRDRVTTLPVNGAIPLQAGRNLTLAGKICLTTEILQKFNPLDLRGIDVVHFVSGDAPFSTTGNVTDIWTKVPLDVSTPHERNETIRFFNENLTKLMNGRPPRVLAIESLGYPLTDEVNAKLGLLRDLGTLIIAPVEANDFSTTVTQYYTAGGIGISRHVIGVGVANQSMNGARLGTPAGPNGMMLAKPDFLVALPDNMAMAQAQVQAVRNVTDLAAILMLKGITDPFIIEEYLRTIAVPSWNGVDAIDNAWRQGYGILNTTNILGFVSNATFSPQNLSKDHNLSVWGNSSKLNHIVDLAPVLLNPSADFGVTTRENATTAHLKLVNPSMVLPSLGDQLLGSPRALLDKGLLPNTVFASEKKVRINVTFYHFPETLLNNASEAMRGLGHESAVWSLMGSNTTDPNLTVNTTSDILSDLNSSRGSLDHPLKPYYFIPETTATVGGDFAVTRISPYVEPLLEAADIALDRTKYLGFSSESPLNASTRFAIQQHRLGLVALRANLTNVGDLDRVTGNVSLLKVKLTNLVAIVPSDPVLKPLNDTVRNYTEQLALFASRTVGAVTSLGDETFVDLTTEAEKTTQAPYGHYFGVVRVIAEDICNNSTATGQDQTCKTIIKTAPTGIYLTRNVNLTVRYRDGTAIPNATVQLFMLDTAPEDTGSCEGRLDSPSVSLEVQLAQSSTRIQTVWRGQTNQDGNTTLYSVLPGFWCSQFPYLFPANFTSHTTAPNGSDARHNESFGAVELTPHQWDFRGMPSYANYTRFLYDWGFCSVNTGPERAFEKCINGETPTYPMVGPARLFSGGVLSAAGYALNPKTAVLTAVDRQWARDQLCDWTRGYNELFGAGLSVGDINNSLDVPIVGGKLGECRDEAAFFQWPSALLMHEAFSETGRVRDYVNGTEWVTNSWPVVPALPGSLLDTTWAFLANETTVTATPKTLTGPSVMGMLRYNFTIPENEVVNIATSFQFEFIGTKGFYVVALGDDAVNSMESTLANVSSAEPTWFENPLQKFLNPHLRITPFATNQPLNVTFDSQWDFNATLQVENHASQGNMSTNAEWMTRGWNPRGGAIFFVFWRESIVSASLLRVTDYDYRAFTYLGMVPAVDASSYAASTGNQVDNTRVNPEAEGWDLLISTSRKLTNVTVTPGVDDPTYLNASSLYSTGVTEGSDFGPIIERRGIDDYPITLASNSKTPGFMVDSYGGGVVSQDNGTWRYLGRGMNSAAPGYLEQRWERVAPEGAGAVDSVIDAAIDPLAGASLALVCPGCQDDLLDFVNSSAPSYAVPDLFAGKADRVHHAVWLNTSFNRFYDVGLTWNETFAEVGVSGWNASGPLPVDPVDRYVERENTNTNYTIEAHGFTSHACWMWVISVQTCATGGEAKVVLEADPRVELFGGAMRWSFNLGTLSVVIVDNDVDDEVPDTVVICQDNHCEDFNPDACPMSDDLEFRTLACHFNMNAPSGFVYFTERSGDVGGPPPFETMVYTAPVAAHVWNPLYLVDPNEAHYQPVPINYPIWCSELTDPDTCVLN
ncbi:MAG: hypothetical protein HY556_05360 [Euryarchaeota archaeon]|nr:hypothetical protein [Euryarchaeota archaeon]